MVGWSMKATFKRIATAINHLTFQKPKVEYIIKWRNRHYGKGHSIRPTFTSLSRYLSAMDAQRQVEKWKAVFPENTYHIEPIIEVPKPLDIS
jgi:hypothetical protein